MASIDGTPNCVLSASTVTSDGRSSN